MWTAICEQARPGPACATSSFESDLAVFDLHQGVQSKANLTRHIKEAHRGVRYRCEQCGKQFTTKQNLNTHFNAVHLKIRHSCPHCSSSFSQKGHLATHIRNKHPNQVNKAKSNPFVQRTPIPCLICSAQFFTFGELLQHTGEKHSTCLLSL